MFFSILAFYLNHAIGQTVWTKYSNNPVLQKGPDNWDAIAIGQPTVLFENDTIKMWYAGVGTDMKARICYAISVDGIEWEKHNNPVLDVGTDDEWDRGWLDTPEILKNNTGYKLYYYGDTVQQSAEISSAIGIAYSIDGINWSKDVNNPIFTKGDEGEWDNSWVESPAILYDDIMNEYKMWYNGINTSTWQLKIGFATSTNGVNWIRYANNPVLSIGTSGSYDDMWLGTPSVIFHNNIYHIWYSSTSASSYNESTGGFDTLNICYAISEDGIDWTKNSSNPLFNTFSLPYNSEIDSKGPWAPDVVFNSNTNNYMMWYETEAGFSFASAPEEQVNDIEIIKNNIISIYPNPFHNIAIITIDDVLVNSSLVIYRIDGKEVFRREHISDNKILINGIDFSKGIYLLKITSNSKVYSQKFVIN